MYISENIWGKSDTSEALKTRKLHDSVLLSLNTRGNEKSNILHAP
jgi:hypothetical protein